MVVLLRSCILSQRKLFTQNVISFKRVVAYNACNYDVKKFTTNLQARYFSSDSKENDGRELIYSGMLTKNLRSLKLLSLISSSLTLLFQPILYMKLLEDGSPVPLGIICAAVNLMSIGTPVMIYVFTKRYVIELYHRPKDEKYIAKVYNFFFKKKEIVFTPDDVDVPARDAMFMTAKVNNSPLLFDENTFVDRKHFFIIMGYNKPVDFKVEKLTVRSINQPQVIDSSRQIENKSNNV